MDGTKSIETRTYPCPEHLLNVDLLLIETPGKMGKFKARIIAIIRFSRCFEYKTEKEFYLDTNRHLVTKNSVWAWKDKRKWGWEIEYVKPITIQDAPNNRGIVFCNDLTLN